MLCRRYAALSVIPLLMFCAGLAAVAAPEPLRGPLVVALAPPIPVTGGGAQLSLSFMQPLYLADAVGLVLLLAAVVEVWVLAIAWERRRPRP